MFRSSKIYKASRIAIWHGIFFFVILVVLPKNWLYAEEWLVSPHGQFRIAIFKEDGFPAIGTPRLLTPEWLYNLLSRYFSVVYLDFPKLSDRKYLNSNNFELLILPYGESFPYEAFPCIKEYLFEGGGLLHIAGRPFWTALRKVENKWQKVNISDPYKEFLSPLGIKYYESLDDGYIGLSITTGLGTADIQPTHGNLFPYRIPVREIHYLETIKDKKNRSPVAFIKNWRNPYLKNAKDKSRKWCLIGAKGEEHPLNPENAYAKKTLSQIMEYLSFPIIIYELETNLAAYRQKEKVEVSLKVMNYSRNAEELLVEFGFFDKRGEMVYKQIKPITLGAGQTITLHESWHPKKLKGDFYKIVAILKKNGKILDKEENGFVVINKELLKKGPTIQIKDNKFLINGKITLLLGVNYYESSLGELMWLRPNILKIREDFKTMRNLGINFVRIHYHHSKWFRDYFSQVVKEKSIEPYFQVADTTALPSERSLRILDAIIQLAQEQGLIFCMDIFSLVSEDMGNPIGWLELKERIIDEDKISIQKKFIELLACRYKKVPGITWDLWNEPRLENNDSELLRRWIKQLKDIFRENGDSHFITVGDNASLYLLDVLDYASLHTYEPSEFSYLKGLDKPFIFQEVWNDAGCSLNDEIRQAEELKKDFSAFLNTESAGFVPWQWTRQARLWDNVSDAERWDDELGLCVHEDGTLKPAGEVYKSLINLTKE